MGKIDSYREALAFLEERSKELNLDFDGSIDIRSGLECRIQVQEIADLFSVEIKNPNVMPDYIEINQFTHISRYGKKTNRAISFPDTGKQPNDELLYEISFPSGAYIFGDSYPQELFLEFFAELKSYMPAHIDSANKSLYFCTEKASAIHSDFEHIFNKYRERAVEYVKAKRIDVLRRELDELES